MPPIRSACCVLYALGHYHHARLRAAAAAGPPVTALEVHGQSEFREFRLEAPGEGANYAVERANGSVPEALARLKPDVVFLPGWGDRHALGGLRWCQRSGTPAVAMSESTRHDSIGDREADPGRPVRRARGGGAGKRALGRPVFPALVGGPPHPGGGDEPG